MQLAGKAALISGAGGGICRAIAVAFAKEGAAIACIDIDLAASAETARLVTEAGGRSLSQACDVASEGQTRAAAEAAHQAFGRLDILVSGAAPHDPSGTIIETSLADWQRVLDINLTGAYLLSRAVLPLMIAGGGGSIIFIASQLGRDEDDRSAAAGDHQGQHGATQQKGAGQVDVEHALPIGEAGLDDCAARIVRRRAADQDVEPTKGLMGRLGSGERLAFAGDVA